MKRQEVLLSHFLGTIPFYFLQELILFFSPRELQNLPATFFAISGLPSPIPEIILKKLCSDWSQAIAVSCLEHYATVLSWLDVRIYTTPLYLYSKQR